MRADLVIDKVSGPDTAAPGSSIAVTTLVRNAGDADAGPFRLSMHLSQDTKVSSDDIMLGYGDVPDLAAGKAREGTAAAVIPAKVKPGTYYLVAMADSLGKITESDKQNNSRAQDTPIIIRSDIPSDSIENNVSILKEQPTQTPPSPTSLTEPTLSSTIIVEPTPTPTTTPVEIATPEPTPEVIKAQSEEVPTPVTDKENSAPDSSLESSKSSSSSLLPDLMPLDVSADSTGIVGEPLQVSTTIYNDGPGDAGPFTVSLILSTDTRIDELKDIILGTGQIESLPAGKQRMGNATFPISSDIKPGKYYFGLFVDSKREINETDEDNNYGYNKIPVIISSR
jgi:subtilase family serine protease